MADDIGLNSKDSYHEQNRVKYLEALYRYCYLDISWTSIQRNKVATMSWELSLY